MWTATRKGYVESGCKFKLQPFTAELESYGNNITSALFGVSKRYTNDPSPVSYNFANTTDTESESETETETESSTPSTDLSLEPATTPTSNASHGLSKASKIGIGVGVPLGVLLLSFLIGAFMIYRRKSRRKEIREITAPNSPGMRWRLFLHLGLEILTTHACLRQRQ